LRELDAFIEETMETLHIPGLAGYVVREGELVWAGARGLASIDPPAPMTLATLQNIASISKTFTATALMQVFEMEAFHLDDDVNDYLPFPVRNPKFPEAPITFRQLLTHRSSIADGTWYSRLYGCGDPTVSLSEWLEGYFTVGGTYFHERENFHDWAPGERYAYNNVAFGLLAYLVETLASEPFPEFCRRRIFGPLGMAETSWYLGELEALNVNKHATPYTWVESGQARSPSWGGEPLGAIGSSSMGPSSEALSDDGEYVPNCLYSHPNFPDGFLRTSVQQLAQFLTAYLRNGEPILRWQTVDMMLSPHHAQGEERRRRGLAWYAREVGGRTFWGHGGADPGVNTRIDLNREDGVGAIVFANTYIDSSTEAMQRINARLIAEAYR
jgi:CubicO group peptidase (beta-lactamase class C family)